MRGLRSYIPFSTTVIEPILEKRHRHSWNSPPLSIWQHWRSVLGGFCIHLVLGTLYCWSILTTAVTSHLRRYEPSVTYNDTIMVYATALTFQGVMMIPGGLLEKHIGARYTCALGGTIIVLGTFSASISTSLAALVVSDGVMFGIGLGLCYAAPMACATRWLPHRKGLVSGIIVAGFGGGAFLFGSISTAILFSPGHKTRDDDLVSGYYHPDSEITNRVPEMFAVLGVCYFFLLSIGCALLNTESPHVSVTLEQKASAAVVIVVDDVWSVEEGGMRRAIRGGKREAYTELLDSSVECEEANESKVGASMNNLTGAHVLNPIVVEEDVASWTIRSGERRGAVLGARGEENNDDDVAAPATAPVKNTYTHSMRSGHSIENKRRDVNGDYRSVLVNDEYPTTTTTTTSTIASMATHNSSGHTTTTTTTRHSDATNSSALSAAGGGPGLNVGPVVMITTHALLAIHLMACFALTASGGMDLAGTYSVFALGSARLGERNDRSFLLDVGATAALFSAVGRVFWGAFADRFGYIETLIVLSLGFGCIILTYSRSPEWGPLSFALWTYAVFFFEGGNFSLYLPVTVQLFGSTNAASNYGLVFGFFELCNVVNITVQAAMNVSFDMASYVNGCLTLAGCMLLCLLRMRVSASPQIAAVHQ